MGAAGSVATLPPSGVPPEVELAIFMDLRDKYSQSYCTTDEESGALFDALEEQYRAAISKYVTEHPAVIPE